MLEGKNIVLTDCMSEFGRQAMISMAENGANLFACVHKRTEEFETYCKVLEKENQVQIIPISCDLSSREGIVAAVREIQATNLDVHGLGNIADMQRTACVGSIKEDDLIETLKVNFISQIVFTQYIAQLMLSQNGGSIVFMSSITALDGFDGQTAYAASKAAVLGAMRSMAQELGKHGIRVNAVAPGMIRTLLTGRESEAETQKKSRMTDLRRLGEIEEVVNVLMYFLSDMSSHVTGQTLRVDGGMR